MIATFMQLIRDSAVGDMQAVQKLLEGFGQQQFSTLDQEQIHLYLKRIAEQSHHAIYLRALLFDQGFGVPRNVDMAFLLMREAASKGNSNAIYEVGHRFLEGVGVDVNYDSAKQWLTIAAISPHYISMAMFDLGRMYEKGWGVDTNLELAKSWFEQAAQKGHTGAIEKIKM